MSNASIYRPGESKAFQINKGVVIWAEETEVVADIADIPTSYIDILFRKVFMFL